MATETANFEDLVVQHVVRGKLLEGDVRLDRAGLGPDFLLPEVDLSDLVWLRSERPPAYDISMTEILDFLEETGKRLDFDTNELLVRAAANFHALTPMSEQASVERMFRRLTSYFSRPAMEFELELNFGGRRFERWTEFETPMGYTLHVLAAPARVLHFLAGNDPGVAAVSIIRGALSRGLNLFKLPSNDPFSAPAILATMAEIDANHPLVQSFSAAYWRGGDDSVESVLFRPQYFDKIVAWGGDAAIRHVQGYLCPGLELIALDPKRSISMIGREAFESAATIVDAARAGAHAVGAQSGCSDSRYQYVEGSVSEVDAYGAELQRQLVLAATDFGSGPTPADIREHVEVLAGMQPHYAVWGRYDGSGLVVRSEEPLDIYPNGRTVNVVRVQSLDDALCHVDVATQTVGIYPSARKAGLRDALAVSGVQQIVTLGRGGQAAVGRTHDGHLVLNRMVRWVGDTY